MELIDTHCHLDFAEFLHDRNDVLTSARNANVSTIIIPAVKRATWETLIAMCDQSAELHYALGLHPVFIEQHSLEQAGELPNFLAETNPVAVGEIGLDFYDRSLDRSKQIEIFQQQLQAAQDAKLPVILHVRKAHDEVLAQLQDIPVVGGIVHAFNGSMQQANKYQQLNFKFGFGGMLTFERSVKLRQLAKELPLESIVLETDAPDMTVAQHHGERNSPAYLPYCLQALAQVKLLEIEDVASCTTQNARNVLRLS